MKLIEKEIAIEIINNDNFIKVDEANNVYELDGVRYTFTSENDLLEIEDEVVEENDSESDIQSASEEVQSEL